VSTAPAGNRRRVARNSIAAANMPGNPVAAQIADRHVATDAALIVMPIVNVKTMPSVVIVITATRSDTHPKLERA